MNILETFLVITAAIVAAKAVNILAVEPLFYHVRIALFGKGEQASQKSGSASSEGRVKKVDSKNRIEKAEKEVNACLNYGGVFHNGCHTTKELTLVYQQGDKSDEVALMRRFAKALNELADAVEEESVN